MIHNLKKLLASIFALFLFLNIATKVSAQPSAGLTVIPPKFELFGNPGDVITETIRIRNESETPMSFGVLVEDFSSAGETGSVVLEEGESDDAYSLKRWIELSSENIALQPGQETSFPFTISIPRDADPGGHYASILFQIGDGEAEPGVTSVQHRVGSLVLMRVSGDVVEDAEIETFRAPLYSPSSPVTFEFRLRNDGTTHISPNGTIIIKNLFGQKVDELPLNGANVFPGAIRNMQTEWDPGNVFGQYTATLVATYGQQGLPLTAVTKFTVASPFAIAMLVIGSIAGIIFLISLVTGRKRVMKALKVLSSGKS